MAPLLTSPVRSIPPRPRDASTTPPRRSWPCMPWAVGRALRSAAGFRCRPPGSAKDAAGLQHELFSPGVSGTWQAHPARGRPQDQGADGPGRRWLSEQPRGGDVSRGSLLSAGCGQTPRRADGGSRPARSKCERQLAAQSAGTRPARNLRRGLYPSPGLGSNRPECRRALDRAAAWALTCRNADGGFGHFPGSPSDADAVYFQVGTLVMTGTLCGVTASGGPSSARLGPPDAGEVTPSLASPLRKSFDDDLATGSDLHFQFVPLQEPHSDQRIGVRFVDKDVAHLAVPHHLGLINIEKALAAVCQGATVHASPAQTQRGDKGRRQRQRRRIARIDDCFNFLLAPCAIPSLSGECGLRPL